ncbi:primase-helicase family protein [Vibrio hibernica]|uniref:primase-helicase family protein n=1 Tax=Vibrio hibernica TaxID=2587465 RepID=UPI0039AFAE55
MRSTVPAEVKSLIETLKEDGFFKLYDNNKDALVYHLPSNSTQPIRLIHDLYMEHTKDGEYKYIEYVIASLDKISGFSFEPKGVQLKKYGLLNKLNTYKQYQPSTFSNDCLLFVELLERLIPDKNERHTFTQWLAHMFQRPQERPSWAVMLTSDQGTGKGVLFHKFINPLVSGQAVQCSNYTQFLGSHSTALSNNLFVMLDDTKSRSDSLITELKSKISEPEILVNPKYLQPYKQKVYARILLASNERRPIKLGAEDTRRWFVPAYVQHKVSPEETQTFISSLLSWLDTDSCALDKVYNYLNEYSLEGFNAGYIEKTEALDLMVEMSVSAKESEVKKWLDENKVFKVEDLQSRFSDYPDLAKDYAQNYCQVKSIALDGNRTRWWIPSNWKPKQAKEWYEAQHLFAQPQSFKLTDSAPF